MQAKLRTHYVHVTGPEASLLMNKEHVRLLKLWQPASFTKKITHKASNPANQTLFDFELPFLHPVQEIVIVIRKVSEMSDSTSFDVDSTSSNGYDMKGCCKNYFAFHGGGKDPNIESVKATTRQFNHGGSQKEAYLKVDGFKLTLNGQERHPSLAGDGISRDYLMSRLMPMLHSNTSTSFIDAAEGHVTSDAGSTYAIVDFNDDNIKALGEMMDRKEIYVYPFALNPEGANPSGAVNFSKVSHAKMSITGKAFATDDNEEVEYRCDVWGVHYNWLQIKDGRAITSFA
jgi:hypothetical protein